MRIDGANRSLAEQALRRNAAARVGRLFGKTGTAGNLDRRAKRAPRRVGRLFGRTASGTWGDCLVKRSLARAGRLFGKTAFGAPNDRRGATDGPVAGGLLDGSSRPGNACPCNAGGMSGGPLMGAERSAGYPQGSATHCVVDQA